MRGIFSAGVLDTFLEQQFHPFDLAIGCSAGACNLASHLAGQLDRNRRCYTNQMARKDFISARRFFQGGHWLDLDWLWDAFLREDPLDVHGATRGPTDFLVAATCIDSGSPVYVRPSADDLLDVLRASCAVPIMYRGFVHHEGRRYTDGGVTDPIPVREAYRRGARKMVVIRSRPAHFVKESKWESRIGSALFRSEPALAKAIRQSCHAYRQAVEFLVSPPQGCEIVTVAPPSPLRTGRATRDQEALEADYQLGRECGKAAIEEWAWLLSSLPEAAPHRTVG